jgi:uncharacterized protein YkwD
MPRPAPRPRRVTLRTLGFGLATVFAAAALAWSPTTTTAWNQGAAESTLWQLLNGARVNNGVAPLQSHGTLVSLARWRSRDMLDRNYFSHTIPGCGCLVYVYYDSNGLKYDWAGENIAWNSGRTDDYSPVRAHEQFMGSPGHRANVLDRRFTHGGVGAAAADNREFLGYVQNTRMYTQLFMQARSAPAPAPTPPPAAPAPPPPAPAPPPSGGGGGGAPAPAQPAPAAAATPAPTPEPKPKLVQVAAPQRPASSAGLDGIATRISRPAAAEDRLARHTLDETAASRVAQLAAATDTRAADEVPTSAAGAAEVEDEVLGLEVSASPQAERGVIETIVGAVIGFLFG